jgi:hypothetical protein
MSEVSLSDYDPEEFSPTPKPIFCCAEIQKFNGPQEATLLALMMLNSHSRPISMTELWFALFPLVVVESRIGQGNNGWRQLYLLAMVQAGLYKFRSTRSMLHSKMSTLRKRASLQAFTAMDNAPAIQGSNTKQNGIHL